MFCFCLAKSRRRSRARWYRFDDKVETGPMFIPKNIGVSKKPKGRLAQLIETFDLPSFPPNYRQNYNTTWPLCSAPSANNEPRRAITRRDFAQIGRVINSRGQSRRVAPSPSADSVVDGIHPFGRRYFNPAVTEERSGRLLIRLSRGRRRKGIAREASRDREGNRNVKN